MSTTSSALAALFARDLARLVRQLDAFDEARLWQVVPGVTNSAGNLMLHLNGNLREFVGRQIGGVPYVRDRTHEFSAKHVPRQELTGALTELASLIPGVIERTTDARWEEAFPENVLGGPLSHRHFVTHLYGHLNYHLGQIDYLRRVLTGEGALAPPPKQQRGPAPA
ncbi:MAG: DinB family protein [Vicinamibacterales bacterium]